MIAMWGLLFLFLFSAFLFFYGLFSQLLYSDKRIRRRRAFFLKENDKKRLSIKKFNLLVQLQLYKQALRQRMVGRKKTDRLADLLDKAGVDLRPEEFVMYRWICAFLGGGILYLFTDRFFLLAFGAGIGYWLPKWWVRQRRNRRLLKFNEGLPDMITTVIGSLRAGFSFAQALKAVTEEADSPIREEIELVLKEMQYGRTIDDALQQLKERMPSEDLDLMIHAILIQKQVGGNLAVVLETIVQTIRERNRIQRQIRTLTAQGRLSGMVIGVLPFALGLIIYLIEPEYMQKFFTHPIGMAMIGAGAVSGAVGFMLIRKLTTIEV